jgi:hypothetical protein
MFKEKTIALNYGSAFLLSPIITSPPRLNIAFPTTPPPCSDPQCHGRPRLAPTANPTRQYYVHVHRRSCPRHWSDERRVVRRRQGLLHQSDESHDEPVVPISRRMELPSSAARWDLRCYCSTRLGTTTSFVFPKVTSASPMIASSMMHAAVRRSHSINLFWMPIIWMLREHRCIASAFCLLSFIVPIYKDVIIWVITA